jgi:Uma2 family endonuclease
MKLAQWANQAFGDGFVRVQGPIAIPGEEGVFNEPEPELSVIRQDTTAYNDRHPGPEDLLLVVEVSDTTLRTDLVLKARLYALTGIAEYWAVDLAARRLHRHRDPSNRDYTEVTVLTRPRP